MLKNYIFTLFAVISVISIVYNNIVIFNSLFHLGI